MPQYFWLSPYLKCLKRNDIFQVYPQQNFFWWKIGRLLFQKKIKFEKWQLGLNSPRQGSRNNSCILWNGYHTFAHFTECSQIPLKRNKYDVIHGGFMCATAFHPLLFFMLYTRDLSVRGRNWGEQPGPSEQLAPASARATKCNHIIPKREVKISCFQYSWF